MIRVAVIAQWSEIRFEISAASALLLDGLKFSVECETKEKEKNKQKYVSYENGKPSQISFTVILNAALGIDVREQITLFTAKAQRGAEDYLYVGGEKLFPFKIRLVKADSEEIVLNPAGKMVSAKIGVTYKQSSAEKIYTKQEQEQAQNDKTKKKKKWKPVTPKKNGSIRKGGPSPASNNKIVSKY